MRFDAPSSRRAATASGKVFWVILFFFTEIVLFQGLFGSSIGYAQSTPVTAGYRDFNFGSNVDNILTGEKPQSKLWFNDGVWWGSMWSPAVNKYTIHRLDFSTQSWSSTGTEIDDRGTSRADVLWDGQSLYIASNVLSEQAKQVSASQAARLYKYTYNASGQTYSLVPGFPVTINSSASEALVLDKDSSGQLWITWMENGKVKVNRTTGSDATWGTPFDLPVQGTNASGDDISTLIAFGGDKIGICWSNQNDKKIYFAVHQDSDADNVWQAKETALGDGSAAMADDHISLKQGNEGSLYAVTKSSLSGDSNAGIYFIKRAPNGTWSSVIAGLNVDEHTRPILVLDGENNRGYIFAKSLVNHNDVIVMKSTSLDNIAFANGIGTPFIQSTTDKVINNPTSTKQTLNGTTELVVLASDETTRYYLHNFLDLNGGGVVPPPPSGPVIASFTPASGVPGTVVTISGSNFTGTSSVKFNGTGTSYLVNSASQLIADVPPNATSGKISVTTPEGTATSAADFVVPVDGASVLTFTPLHDTFVRLSAPTGTNGTLSTLRSRNTSSETIAIYLKFDVSGLSGSVNSAKLRLKVVDASADGGSVYPVSNNYLGTSTPWTQTDLNWNNAPAVSGAPLSTAGSVATDAIVELDVTAAITGNGIFSFALKNDISDLVQYSSQEGATKPELVISTDDSGTPPPALPTISSFTPESGSPGTAVTISGANLAGTLSVEFNDTPATFTVNSASQLSADVPPNAITGKISVITPEGIATSAADFVVPVDGASVLTFTPVHDAYVKRSSPTSTSGTASTLRSRNTSSETLVTYLKFDVTGIGGSVTSAKVRLKVVDASPDGGSLYSVSNNYLGTSTPWLQTGLNWNNAPAISGTPLSTAGAAANGAFVEFDVTAAVTANGVFSFALRSNISDVVQYSSQEGATKPELVITTDDSGTPPPPPAGPSIAGFAPLSGPVGTEVTITGTNFTGAANVDFSGSPAASLVVDSASQIRAVVPAGATSGPITVATGDGSVASDVDFTVTSVGGGTTSVVNSVQDTYARMSTPTSTFGTASTMRVRKTGSDELRSYLKFEVQGLSGTVTGARLRLYVTDASPTGGAVYSISNDYSGTTTPWTQTGLNWNNAPLVSGSPISTAGGAAVGNWLEFDVTTAITGDGDYSFAILTTSSDAVYYATREATNKPELVIETGSAPQARELRTEETFVASSPIATFSLKPNYPNPFNGQTTIEYTLPEATSVRLSVYNSLGQLVRKLVDETQSAGYKRTMWDGRNDRGENVGSGVYFYRLEAGGHRLNGRMILQQ